MSNPKMTPMMQQYYSIKAEHTDAVLFFRMGDFYEMFGEDAVEVSQMLDITLTNRNGIEMCGIPYHAYQNYVKRLLKLGQKVAICEQISMPEKGIAKREVVEIISPGTIVDDSYLDSSQNNYLLALCAVKNGFSLAYCDLSTGEFVATQFIGTHETPLLKHELARLNVSEIIVPEEFVELLEEDNDTLGLSHYLLSSNILLNKQPNWYFNHSNSLEQLKKHFNVINLKSFNLNENSPAIVSAGAIINHLAKNLQSVLPHLRSLRTMPKNLFVGLDEATQRNLELTQSLNNSSDKYTLYHVMNDTKTAMGARLLRKWLFHPLKDLNAIQKRQQMVSLFHKNQKGLTSVREKLSKILDGERLLAKVAVGKAHAKDMFSLKNSLQLTKELAVDLLEWDKDAFALYFPEKILNSINTVSELLERAIMDDPSILLHEGKLIKLGYDAQLDEIKRLTENKQQILQEYLLQERTNSGINNLKLKYNKVIGYFFDITKSQLHLVPEYFIRRQTLVGSERFTTIKLGELEQQMGEASSQLFELEKRLFLEVREQAKQHLTPLLISCEALAKIDVYQSFAHSAIQRNYVQPHLDNSTRIQINHGRHPVVETNLATGEFIANSSTFDEDLFFALITGPNMAGKSTYLRQNALLVLMAQMGAYIPAQSAEIGLVDHIFCRVGASDNLARGESTFLVEMNETAYILNTATKHSLIIMDEVGRGTSTNDGLSIAWAVCEYILNKIQANTLFATHFHELTHLQHASLRNFSLEVKEQDGRIWFLKKVIQRPADSSYGVHVASLAGVPDSIINRANQLMTELEAQLESPHVQAAPVAPTASLELFNPNDLLLQEIKNVNINELTPLQAMNLVEKWRTAIG